MAKRDYTSSPVSDSLGLSNIIKGLADDLAGLRAGTVSPQDALARAALAKQIFNGVRLYLVGAKYINATPEAPVSKRVT